ncbi:hypothetical protein HWV62_26779 [Athelia sp. TMB]|nr:hypothetical protein HWV62_26779 [Athelia sp. TMB]
MSTFKARGTSNVRKIRGKHIIVGSSDGSSLGSSQAAYSAMKQDGMPIAGPSGVRAAFPAGRARAISRPPTPPIPAASLNNDRLSPVSHNEDDVTAQPPTLKRDAQWQKWNHVVFPQLIPLYLHLQRISQGFNRLQDPDVVACSCGGKDVKRIEVMWYYALVDGAAAHMLAIVDDARAGLQPSDKFPSSWPHVSLPPSSPLRAYSSPDRFSTPEFEDQASSPSSISSNLPQSQVNIPPSSNAPSSRSPSPSSSPNEEAASPRPSSSPEQMNSRPRPKDVAAMEAEVAAARSRQSRNPQPAPPADHDSMEVGMGVPTSVLNDCNDSFLAADEKREKASTQHFADTGLMSMICRHDRLLFLVNTTHRGERQHYALALIQALFSHIPEDMTVGILYDIGCQLKRSMLKFGYLADVFNHIMFGVSYHQRLFLLDTQIQHLTGKSTEGLGAWLSRCYESCIALKQEASAELLHSKKDKTFLRAQWHAQGKQAIEGILVLDGSIHEEANLVNQLHNDYVAGRGDTFDVADLLKDAETRLSRMQQLRNQKFKALGISEAAALNGLKNNNFLKTWMNALAVKQRLRDRLRQRKFELERLERSYRRTINDSKADSQVNDALKRRAPAIQRLAKIYNSLCDSLSSMLRQRHRGQVPHRAVAPQKIPEGGLWALDVDDSIWQDVGLDELSQGAPPPWLSDEDTRAGIRAMLKYDRACEEEARLLRERVALQDWLIEEWAVIQRAKSLHQDDIDMLYRTIAVGSYYVI